MRIWLAYIKDHSITFLSEWIKTDWTGFIPLYLRAHLIMLNHHSVCVTVVVLESNQIQFNELSDNRQCPAFPCVSFLTPRLYIHDLDAICSLQVGKQVPMNNCVVLCPGSDSSPGWLTAMPADAESWLCAATWSNSGDGHGHWSWVIAHTRSPEILTRNICIEMSPWSEKKNRRVWQALLV